MVTESKTAQHLSEVNQFEGFTRMDYESLNVSQNREHALHCKYIILCDLRELCG